MHAATRFALILSLSALPACEEPATVALGEASSLIVVAPERLWQAVDDTVMSALEPRIFTVREERTFEVTHVAPTEQDWLELREFKQVVLIGYEGDPWLERAVEAMDDVPQRLPAIRQVGTVWARGQDVTLVLLPRGAGAEAVGQIVPELHEVLDARYRQYVRNRMYLSGRDQDLERELREEAGFSLALPDVYVHEAFDSAHVFRNHYAIGSTELRRAVLATWRRGAQAVDSAGLAAWRESVSGRAYGFEQQVAQERMIARAYRRPDAPDGTPPITELQGVWETPPGEYPAAGPFIARAVPCPEQDRTYLLDAWLYAPGEPKYEYMIQLENILDSFQCAAVS